MTKIILSYFIFCNIKKALSCKYVWAIKSTDTTQTLKFGISFHISPSHGLCGLWYRHHVNIHIYTKNSDYLRIAPFRVYKKIFFI